MSHDWKLTVRFGYEYDDVLPSPTGEEEAKQFVAYVLKDWAMDAEDLDPGEMIRNGSKVTITEDNLQYLETAVRYIMLQTVPKKFSVKRLDD